MCWLWDCKDMKDPIVRRYFRALFIIIERINSMNKIMYVNVKIAFTELRD